MLAEIRNKINEKVIKPFSNFLISGMSPKKLALTLALGFTIGVFPVLGLTTIICFAAAFLLKLNPAAIQLVNYVAYPLQILFILPQYKAGVWLFGGDSFEMTVEEITTLARVDFFGFLDTFFWASFFAITVWTILSPFLIGLIYFSVLRPLQSISKKIKFKDSGM